jgi:hypothetical protein
MSVAHDNKYATALKSMSDLGKSFLIIPREECIVIADESVAIMANSIRRVTVY